MGNVLPSRRVDSTDNSGFAVIVNTLGGEAFEISGLHEQMSLGALFAKVSMESGLQPYEVQLCQDTRLLTQGHSALLLQDLGLQHGVELTLVRRAPVRLLDVGASRFNANYYCTVLSVAEVGLGVLEVQFRVVGNMSMGKLQDPAASTLSTRKTSNAAAWRCKAVKAEYTKDNRQTCVEGTLTFEGVPMDQSVSFRFGSSGYSPTSYSALDIDLAAEQTR